MLTIHPQYITDSAGKTLVILPVNEFASIMEDLEDIRLYDNAKSDNEPSVNIDEAFKMIESKRQSKK